jgi:hypothetical protein
MNGRGGNKIVGLQPPRPRPSCLHRRRREIASSRDGSDEAEQSRASYNLKTGRIDAAAGAGQMRIPRMRRGAGSQRTDPAQPRLMLVRRRLRKRYPSRESSTISA